MSKPNNNTISIMFADISGSTKLYDTLGDTDAEACISSVISMMTGEVTNHLGTNVKAIGDEILAYFETADSALDAANAIQEASKTLNIYIRIGIHTGQAIKKDNDIFGDAVNVSARVSSIAKGGQILVSKDFYSQLAEHKQTACRLFDRTNVKGKEKLLDIFQIVTEEEDQTIIFTKETNHQEPKQGVSGLQLDYEGESIVIPLSDDNSIFTIGRGIACNLQVNTSRASRFHLEITQSRNKFILNDQSTNGTTVTLESGEEIFLKRESYPLIGKGKFTFGADKTNAVMFELKNTIE